MLYAVDRSAAVLKPTLVFLQWLNHELNREGSAVELTLKQIQSNCRVFLLPPQDSPEAVMGIIGAGFDELFRLEVASWFEDCTRWPPVMTLDTFWQFFELEIMDEVFDLADTALTNSPLGE